MAVSTSTGDQEPCLLSIDCMTCTDSLACADADVTLEENVISNHNLTRYGTNLEYHCDLGREFQINATLFSPTVSLECQWDKTWNPSENVVLPTCECKLSLMIQFHEIFQHVILTFLGVACVNPPIPAEDKNIVVNYVNGTTVAFNDVVTYNCKSDHYFEEDYNMTGFEVTCLPGGTWTPLPDKQCIHPDGVYKLQNLPHL